jgi:hypothetical protein
MHLAIIYIKECKNVLLIEKSQNLIKFLKRKSEFPLSTPLRYLVGIEV